MTEELNGDCLDEREAAEREVRDWMGENDVILKTPAFRSLVKLVLWARASLSTSKQAGAEPFGYIADFEWGSSDGNSRIYKTPKPEQGMVVPVYLAPQTPIDMVLHCPTCHLQHVDAPDERTPDWKNEPHRSHLCHGCGHIWRPADVPTNGVQAVKTTGKADSPLASLGGVDEPRAVIGYTWTQADGKHRSIGAAPHETNAHNIEPIYYPLAAPGAAIAAREQEATELLAIADFLGGAKDRLNRPDASANDQMRAARAAIQSAALRHGVAGGHHTYLDQCAAVLRAIAGDRK